MLSQCTQITYKPFLLLWRTSNRFLLLCFFLLGGNIFRLQRLHHRSSAAAAAAAPSQFRPAQKRFEEEKTNANGASLVLGWQKIHMKKIGQWINQKAEEDFTSADDPSSVDEAMVLRNALGEGRCHNRGVGRKLKCVSRYPQPSQPTNQGTSSTTTIAAMEEKMVGMQQVMGMMYYNMQQMQQALCAQNPNYQPAVQFSDPTLSAQNLNFQQMMMQFNEHARGLHELRDEETTSDDE
ncbi:hypothetical protein LXL04_021385 [Taraxacum kok-saghyz]